MNLEIRNQQRDEVYKDIDALIQSLQGADIEELKIHLQDQLKIAAISGGPGKKMVAWLQVQIEELNSNSTLNSSKTKESIPMP